MWFFTLIYVTNNQLKISISVETRAHQFEAWHPLQNVSNSQQLNVNKLMIKLQKLNKARKSLDHSRLDIITVGKLIVQ